MPTTHPNRLRERIEDVMAELRKQAPHVEPMLDRLNIWIYVALKEAEIA